MLMQIKNKTKIKFDYEKGLKKTIEQFEVKTIKQFEVSLVKD